MINVEWLTHLCFDLDATEQIKTSARLLGAYWDVHDFTDWNYLRSAKNKNRDNTYTYTYM